MNKFQSLYIATTVSVFKSKIFLISTILCACFLILKCDPVDPDDSTYVLMSITEHDGQIKLDHATDTTGNKLRFIIVVHKPEGIKKVHMQVIDENNSSEFDTTVEIGTLIGTDYSFEFKHAFLVSGEKTVLVSALSNENSVASKSMKLTLIQGPFVNAAPVVTITGVKQIKSGQSCVLIVAIKDDSGQTNSTVVIYRKNQYLLDSNSQFIVKTADNFVGFDTVEFVVSDNYTPPLTTRKTVVIPVISNNSDITTDNRLLNNILQLSPENNVTGVSLKPTLKWSGGIDPDGSAVTYTLKYGNTATNLSTTKTGLTDTIYTLTNSLTANTQYYWQVVAKSSVNSDSTISEVWSFRTTEAAPVIETHPSTQSAVVGSKAIFTVVATGDKLSYQWQKGKTNISGANLANFTTTATTSSDDSSTYRCIVSNDGGADTSRVAILTIEYKVLYDGNGKTAGSVPSDANTYTKGETVTVKTNSGSLEKTGYTFSGWNTKADGNGTNYNEGATTLEMAADGITLYAKWANMGPVWKIFPTSDTTYYRPTIDLSKYCSDPEGTTLTFGIVSGTSASLSGSILKYCADGKDVIIKASDSCGAFTLDTIRRCFNNSLMKNIPSMGKSFEMGTQDTFVIDFYDDDEDTSKSYTKIWKDGAPIHRVSFTRDFFIDSTEVTQADYANLLKVNPSIIKGDLVAVHNILWDDAAYYCNARSKRDGLDTVYKYSSVSASSGSGIPGMGCVLEDLSIDITKNGYRLPFEAEWEFACRGGTMTKNYWPDNAINVALYAWKYYVKDIDSENGTVNQVGKLIPNQYCLYDMIGNVAEWCNDYYSSSYSAANQTDPRGPDNTGMYHVTRGAFGQLSYIGPVTVQEINIPPNSGFRNNGPQYNVPVGFRCVRTKF